MANIGTPKNTRVALFVQGSSALPYNLTTGFDTNGDTVINDRPNGATRNTLRGAANINLNLRLSKTFAFGPQQQTTGDGMPRFRGGPPGGGRGGPGGPGMMMMDGGTNRYKMEFYVQAFNLLNRTNFQSFVGNLTSDYYGDRAVGGTCQAHRGGDQLRVLNREGSEGLRGRGARRFGFEGRLSRGFWVGSGFRTPNPRTLNPRTEPSDPLPLANLEPYARTLITTRRFCARPSLVLFGDTGLSSP